jgi:XisI protein
MESLDAYREIIERTLTEYASVPYAHGDIQTEPVFDRERNRYLLVNVGWHDDERVHGALVHVEIIGDKIWIQRDGTEHGIAKDLVAAGIPRDRIVLGFRVPESRPYTGFAVG